MVLYEMFSGKKPFEGMSEEEVKIYIIENINTYNPISKYYMC